MPSDPQTSSLSRAKEGISPGKRKTDLRQTDGQSVCFQAFQQVGMMASNPSCLRGIWRECTHDGQPTGSQARLHDDWLSRRHDAKHVRNQTSQPDVQQE
jgi:hypothetical protein